ncbi:antA/AntB antirepressor family protein [Larkinella bovis]|uniref:AntA/AntB antirepressor family protein n=1 Tax=Larkinella bovis TaxID=683041 RepID=A0ABW0I9D5_9BACT
MKTLIPISHSDNGHSTVSARELHEFLTIKTPFHKWIDRMLSYGFKENQDYVVTDIFVPNSKGGKQQVTDYALILNCAKEIAMLQRSEKGKQARQYFIDCEQRLRQQLPALQNINRLVEQVLSYQQQRLAELETAVKRLTGNSTEQAASAPMPIHTDEPPQQTTRNLVRQLVNQYCHATQKDQPAVWRQIYQRLYYLYNINIRAHKRSDRESWLDVADRCGHLGKLHSIVNSEFKI